MHRRAVDPEYAVSSSGLIKVPYSLVDFTDVIEHWTNITRQHRTVEVLPSDDPTTERATSYLRDLLANAVPNGATTVPYHAHKVDSNPVSQFALLPYLEARAYGSHPRHTMRNLRVKDRRERVRTPLPAQPDGTDLERYATRHLINEEACSRNRHAHTVASFAHLSTRLLMLLTHRPPAGATNSSTRCTPPPTASSCARGTG